VLGGALCTYVINWTQRDGYHYIDLDVGQVKKVLHEVVVVQYN
jgi:polynucleotide 5'-kinase involved in rRNA processing